MDYSNHVTPRLLSICDARYGFFLLHSQKNIHAVISRRINQNGAPQKNEPAKLARGGSRSPLALLATDFFVRRAHDAPLFDTCHHAPQHINKPLIFNY